MERGEPSATSGHFLGGSSANRLGREPEHERGTECSPSREVRPSDRYIPLTPDPSTDSPPGSHGDPSIASSRNPRAHRPEFPFNTVARVTRENVPNIYRSFAITTI